MSKKSKKKSKKKVVPIRGRGFDGLSNVYTGMGGSGTKTYHNQFDYGFLTNYEQWEAAYQSNWIARRVVDVFADDLTSSWRTIKSEDAELIHRAERDLGVQASVNEAVRWARLYGGSGILMLTGQDLTKPLDIEKIQKGDLERLVVFDRWSMSTGDFNLSDVLQKNFLKPEYYTLTYASSNPSIHYSHFALFYGDPLPLRLLTQTQGWGDSVLRKGIEEIKQLQAAVNGIAELLQEANVDIIRADGLIDALSNQEEDAIMKRYQLLREGKSNFKMTILDRSEEYERKTLSLGGVDSSIQTLMTMVCGAYNYPMTKLFGTSARGMNATGEGDRKDYYDSVESHQRGALSESMQILDQVLVRSATGSFPDSFDYEWNPLEENDSLQSAQTQLTEAEKHIKLLESNVITKSMVQRVLQSSEQYQFNDEEIEELEQLEQPNLFEENPLV